MPLVTVATRIPSEVRQRLKAEAAALRLSEYAHLRNLLSDACGNGRTAENAENAEKREKTVDG